VAQLLHNTAGSFCSKTTPPTQADISTGFARLMCQPSDYGLCAESWRTGRRSSKIAPAQLLRLWKDQR
jgi:hypothetical protein